MAEPSTSTEMVRVPILGENGRISDDYIPESIPQAVTAAEQAAESAASSANQALQQAAAAEKAASSATGSVEQAKTYANNASTYMSTAESHAESAATDAQAASVSASAAAASATAAEVSNKSAAQSSADAMGFRNNAVQYRDQAREAAQEAQGYVTTVQQLEQNATNSATAAQNSATSASASAETATTAASQASTSATSAAASAQTASQKADAVLDHYIESAHATTLEPGSQATAIVADKVLQLGIPKGEKGDTGLGVPEGGSEGQVLTRTATDAEWAYDSGSVYNTEGGAQQLSDTGSMDPIYNFGLTQGGMSSSLSVMGDSPEVATDYTSGTTSYRNAIGADAKGPYVDLNLSGAAEGATKYRYIDDPSKFATSDGIPTTKAVSSAIGASIITGTSTGIVATASDAYAAKPLEICIKGETRQNLWVNPITSFTQNGMTITPNSDGSVTINGTSTRSNLIEFKKSYALKPGTQYTLSVDKLFPMNGSENSGGFYIQGHILGESNVTIAHLTSDSAGTITFTVPENTDYCVFGIQVINAATVSGTYRVMLNKGSEAEPWCPPGLNSVGDGGSVKVVTAGKNLFEISQEFSDLSAWSATQLYDEGDGWVRAEAVSGAIGIWYKKSKIRFMPTTYTVSFEAYANKSVILVYNYIMDSEDGNVGLAFYGDMGPRVTTEKQRVSFQFTLDKELNGSFMTGVGDADAVGVELHIRNIQLELGSTATAYEPPNITTTPIDLDGNSLCSLPDGTCDELIIEADGSASIVKRVHEQKFTANDFRTNTINNSQAPLSADTSLGAGFLPSQQMNDFAPVANADSVNYLVAGVFNSADFQMFRVGKIGMGTDQYDCLAKVKSTIGSATIKALYPLAAPETIPLPAVTLPTLPSPNITVYHDSDVPSDITVEYVRDINIVLANLEAKVSELSVNQASN